MNNASLMYVTLRLCSGNEKGSVSLPHKTIQYASRYMGYDTIQGRYDAI